MSFRETNLELDQSTVPNANVGRYNSFEQRSRRTNTWPTAAMGPFERNDANAIAQTVAERARRPARRGPKADPSRGRVTPFAAGRPRGRTTTALIVSLRSVAATGLDPTHR